MRNIFVLLKSLGVFPFFFLIYPFVGKRACELLKGDFERCAQWKQKSCSIGGFNMLFVQYPEFRNVVYNRIGYLKVLVCWLWRGQTNLSIACHDIGPGLIVQHGYSTVVAARKIGRNFSVNQCVNIVWSKDDIPVIGDNVVVCAGAIIVGGVKIGNNVTIGAGAVVVKDIADNTVVVGQPSRMLKR